MEKYELHFDHRNPTIGDTLELLASVCADKLNDSGSVVLVPTETVYGLIGKYGDAAAIDRIYELKKRAENKPLALFIANVLQLEEFGLNPPEAAYKLVENFCPGPITVVFDGPDGNTIGFRIPDHPLVLRILEFCGFPLASTSANLSGHPNALTAANALADLDGEPDILVDGGELPHHAIASTVVQLTGNSWKILREGPVTAAMLTDVLGPQ